MTVDRASEVEKVLKCKRPKREAFACRGVPWREGERERKREGGRERGEGERGEGERVCVCM